MKANQLWLFVSKNIGNGWFYWHEWKALMQKEYTNIPDVFVPDTVSTPIH